MNRILAKIGWHWGARFLLRFPQLEQFFIFSVIGVVNTAVDFLIFLFATRFLGIYYIVANVISFTVATTGSFFLNRRFTFRDHSRQLSKQYPKFFVVTGIGFLLNTAILYVLVDFFAVLDVIAKVAAIVVVLFWNFGINKFWTFRNVSASPTEPLAHSPNHSVPSETNRH